MSCKIEIAQEYFILIFTLQDLTLSPFDTRGFGVHDQEPEATAASPMKATAAPEENDNGSWGDEGSYGSNSSSSNSSSNSGGRRQRRPRRRGRKKRPVATAFEEDEDDDNSIGAAPAAKEDAAGAGKKDGRETCV